MSPHDEQLVDAAHRFYAAHQREHLARDSEQLIERCAAHLVDACAIAGRVALDAAMQARAELDAGDTCGYVDLDRSTSRMVVVRDIERSTVHMVTVSELLAIVRARTPAPPYHAADPPRASVRD